MLTLSGFRAILYNFTAIATYVLWTVSLIRYKPECIILTYIAFLAAVEAIKSLCLERVNFKT